MLNVKGKPYLWARCDKHGWLWTRTGRQGPWSRCWIVIKGSLLVVFQDEKEAEPLEAVRLHAGGGLSEDSLSESETKNKRYSKAITLKAPRSATASEPEEMQSLLHFRDISGDRLSRFQRLWFAAETEKQHLDWHKHFIRGTVAAGRIALDDSRSCDSNSSSSSSCSLGPSPIVAYRLCGPGRASGETLLKSFKDIRRTLEQGIYNLGKLREEGRAAQGQLSDLSKLLKEMSQQIQDHSSLKLQMSTQGWEADKHILDACEDWLRQAETLVDEADAKIEVIMRSEGGSLLAEEWVTFVHKYSMQMKDIEQALQAGQLMEKRQRDYKMNGPLSKVRCTAAPRSSMPYSTYWARKIAI